MAISRVLAVGMAADSRARRTARISPGAPRRSRAPQSGNRIAQPVPAEGARTDASALTLAFSQSVKAVAAKLAVTWDLAALATKISAVGRRRFQPAWQLLEFIRETAPRRFDATVRALDWEKIDVTIGDAWALSIATSRSSCTSAISRRRRRSVSRCALARDDALGEMTRSLRKRMPAKSRPRAKDLEPLT